MRAHLFVIAVGIGALGSLGCGDDTAVETGVIEGSIQECVKTVGWQSDLVVDAANNGITNADGDACGDATTVEWYEESPTTDGFTKIIAWEYPGSCAPRTPAAVADGAICTITGTHTWETVTGFAAGRRMVMTETIASVSGDWNGDGTDDKCGPGSILEGTTTKFVVSLDGGCESGESVWMWEPVTKVTEDFPGSLFDGSGGTAIPEVLCHSPGIVGPDDHLPGRMLCPAAQAVDEPE